MFHTSQIAKFERLTDAPGAPLGNSKARWYALAVAVGTLLALLVANPAIKPLWGLLAISGLAAMLEVLRKYPAVMLVPVIFIPQWKDLPFLQRVQDRIDLTLVSLIILSLVIAVSFLTFLWRGGTVKALFAGQARGVTAFFAFAGIVALSYSYTAAPNWGLTQATRLCAIGGLLFLSPFILIKREKDFRQFAITFVIFAIALSAQIVYMPHYAVDQWGWVYAVKSDIGGAWVVGMAVLLLFYYSFGESAFWKWVWRLLCAPPLFVGLIAATSRGPMLALLLVFVLAPLVSGKKAAGTRMLTSLGIFLAIMTTGLLVISLLPHQVRAKYQEKMPEVERLLHGSWPGGTVGERLDFYKAALAEIPEHPVLGLGVGGWSAYYYGRDAKNYPHNLFLLVGVEEGLAGLIALVAFLWIVGSAIRRILAITGDRYVLLFALVFFCLAVSMFSGDLDTNRLLWLWCGVTFAFARMLGLKPGRTQAPRTWKPAREAFRVEAADRI